MLMWRYINEERDDKSFMGVETMKLLCTVSKILMCWKLCHETPIEDGLIVKLVFLYLNP